MQQLDFDYKYFCFEFLEAFLKKKNTKEQDRKSVIGENLLPKTA